MLKRKTYENKLMKQKSKSNIEIQKKKFNETIKNEVSKFKEFKKVKFSIIK